MSKIEKFTGSVLIAILAVSFSIYGVWKDKMTFLAPIVALLYLTFAIWGIGLRCCCKVAEKKQEPLNHQLMPFIGMTPPGGIWLLIFWFYSAIMIPFSTVPYEAKVSTLRFGCYVGAYWASANILSRFPRRKAVWSVLLMALLAVALYSLVQHNRNPEMLFGLERYTNYGERLGGTYICPNHIAHLFQMWIPFCLVFLFIPQFSWFWRICFGYALPVFGLLIYRTQSRAGLLGSIASFGVLFLLVMLRKSRKAFVIALVIAPLLMAAGVGGLWFGSAMFRERMQPVVKVLTMAGQGEWEQVASLDFRPMTWFDAVEMAMERPWFGYGPGNYGQVFPEHRKRWLGVRRETVHPHNELIELLTEYGLLGLGLFVGALVSLCVALVRLIKPSGRLYHALPAAAFLAALVGTLVHGLFDFELRIFPNALMFAVLAGCAVAPIMQQRSDVSSQRSAGFCLPSALRFLTSILLLFVAAWSIQVMSSAFLRVNGDRLRLSGNRTSAKTLYKFSAVIDPQSWPAYLGLGQVYSHHRYQELDPVKKQKWAELERDAFAKAYRHNTKKEEVVYGLGRAELAVGNREAGLELLRQAANYKRFNDFYWRKLGIELRKAGLYKEAIEVFSHARKLNRSNKTVIHNLLWLKQRVGDE